MLDLPDPVGFCGSTAWQCSSRGGDHGACCFLLQILHGHCSIVTYFMTTFYLLIDFWKTYTNLIRLISVKFDKKSAKQMTTLYSYCLVVCVVPIPGLFKIIINPLHFFISSTFI